MAEYNFGSSENNRRQTFILHKFNCYLTTTAVPLLAGCGDRVTTLSWGSLML